jgi:hypothetical protein
MSIEWANSTEVYDWPDQPECYNNCNFEMGFTTNLDLEKGRVSSSGI